MQFPDFDKESISLIAAAAEACIKPWKFSVVLDGNKLLSAPPLPNLVESFDINLLLECRDSHGIRHVEKDLELEIYRSGNELNLTISWHNISDNPILWQGQHAIWMNPSTGQKCQPPHESIPYESFARKIRALFS